MTLEKLQSEMIQARKNADKQKVAVLSNMIDAIKKASMTPKGRIDITEQLVAETLIKYQKTVQEQYDTCPDTADSPKREAELKQRKAEYLKELELVKQYAPQLLTDSDEIKKAILDTIGDIQLVKSNRGNIMKVIASQLKGKADMGVVSKVVGGMLQ
jgi:uncharacterized protein YqeY